jgi:hypothetical protein
MEGRKMKLTIIVPDNIVIVDGEPVGVDVSGFASLQGIHAVQWDGKRGHLEYAQDDPDEFRHNTVLTSIDDYADVIEAWHARRKEVEAEEAERQRKLQQFNSPAARMK